jgi:hypothetical protein
MSRPLKLENCEQQKISVPLNYLTGNNQYSCIKRDDIECLLWILTRSMEQSPSWEDNRFSTSHEIPHILWNPKVHYRTYECPIYSELFIKYAPLGRAISKYQLLRMQDCKDTRISRQRNWKNSGKFSRKIIVESWRHFHVGCVLAQLINFRHLYCSTPSYNDILYRTFNVYVGFCDMQPSLSSAFNADV